MRAFRQTLSERHEVGALAVRVHDFAEWTRMGYVIKFKVTVRPSPKATSMPHYWSWPVKFMKDYGFDSRNPQVFLRKEDAMRKYEGIKFALIGHYSTQENDRVYQSP